MGSPAIRSEELCCDSWLRRLSGCHGADLLARPVLPETVDQAALELEDRDLLHPLAYALRHVIELRQPFGDGRVAVEVEVQQLARDVRLRAGDL
jgi:hypothetical protein